MKNKTYLRWGLTIVLSACAILVFYNTFFQDGVLLVFMKRLSVILTPIIYGFALAYLLTPVVNFFDRIFIRYIKKRGAVRALSIFFTWVIVVLLFYGLLNILIPELIKSVALLISNLETYYTTIYNWVNRLVENNPEISGWALNAVREYYKELLSWVYDSWLPQAQQTVMLVTGGIVSVLVFFKDFLVGIIVSVYLLAAKESFALHSRKLLYSLTGETQYAGILRGASATNRIFSGFVRGKLLDSLIIGILCFIGSSLLSFPYAPLVSVIVGVTNVIPFFGPFLGAIPSAFLILLVDPLQCLYFIIFVLVLQQFDGNILGPKILGDSTGLSSFWVIVAILVGGGFAGVLGMFLGVPVFACVHTLINYLIGRRLAKKGATDDAMFAANAPLPESESAPAEKDKP